MARSFKKRVVYRCCFWSDKYKFRRKARRIAKSECKKICATLNYDNFHLYRISSNSKSTAGFAFCFGKHLHYLNFNSFHLRNIKRELLRPYALYYDDYHYDKKNGIVFHNGRYKKIDTKKKALKEWKKFVAK